MQKIAQKNVEGSIFLTIDLFLIFGATFSSYKTVFGLPLFFIFWTTVIVVRRNFIVSRWEILTQLIITFALFPLLIQFYQYDFAYYFGIFTIILYVNILAFAINVIQRLLSDSSGSHLVKWLPAIVLIFLAILTQRLAGNETRQSLIFGVNIYYRIIAMIFFLHLTLNYRNYTVCKNKKSIFSLIITIFILLVALNIMLKTGSRGATIVGITMLLSFIYTVFMIKSRQVKYMIFLMISSLGIFIAKTILSTNLLDSRVFLFYDRGASSGSISARQDFLSNLPSFFIQDNYLLGEGSNYIYSYPHNLYLDFLYNGGFYPCMALFIFTIMYGIALCRGQLNPTGKILTLVYSPIYIGSLFSGTIYNNYPIITLIFMMPIWIMNIEKHRNKIKPKSMNNKHLT